MASNRVSACQSSGLANKQVCFFLKEKAETANPFAPTKSWQIVRDQPPLSVCIENYFLLVPARGGWVYWAGLFGWAVCGAY
ncbi:MAG: hypothetical protein A3J93_00905 [Candidatus Magasanikbacteria bacterium RIFOXYC2_FULL_42_28]|uniref:Uncharacterized protein n=1 Tax=Candidatus Magasanikbacteria bacterium RIFOXYC2_FULL_42_28 TaxID=1798704 RepID=A0A1F6NXN6_9BACT|nr:MAG: hypothetical protein A3J93_00905 [Candidatus Magasanikbacteria bacterium RIFOXYC2_FULL_42_28]